MGLKFKLQNVVFFIFVVVFSHSSLAYYSVLETGQILEEGEYKASAELQAITDGPEGANFVGRFDTWLSEELNSQFLIGAGEVDFQLGGFVKWVPFPDIEQQPAIGLKLGGLFARFGNQSELSLRLSPFASKKFDSEIGLLTPYLTLPFGVRTIDGETDTPIQLAFGTEWKPLALDHISFIAEAGFDIDDAFTYISIAAQLTWNDTDGIQFQ